MGLLDFKSSKGRQKPSLVGSIPTRFRHFSRGEMGKRGKGESEMGPRSRRARCPRIIERKMLLLAHF